MKKGFTLVELMIVIGIIGVLMGVILGVTSRSGDSAQAAKCMTNMKNLAMAVQSAATEANYYPVAGSVARMKTETKRGQNSTTTFTEQAGWISWNSKDAFPTTSMPSPSEISMYEKDDMTALYALTNGCLWKYTNGNRAGYTCPMHLKKKPGARWSYLMNARFGWNANPSHAYGPSWRFVKYGTIAADRTLLFGEVPFDGPNSWMPEAGAQGTDGDAVLQYDGCDKTARVAQGGANGHEHIGANHKQGRDWFAHVAFADGHVEKIRALKDGDELKRLTTFLCEGKAYTESAGRYEELD